MSAISGPTIDACTNARSRPSRPAALLQAFALDSREIEPSANGFVSALAGALGRPPEPLPETAAALGAIGERVVLAIDTDEVLGLLDAWVSTTLVPALPAHVRVVLVGREPPSGPESTAAPRQGRSDGRGRHIRSTLDAGGTWMIVEPSAGDRIEDNLHPLGRLRYGFSTLVCTPGSLSQDGRAGLGTLAGGARLSEVVLGAGFGSVRRAAETPFNLVLEAKP